MTNKFNNKNTKQQNTAEIQHTISVCVVKFQFHFRRFDDYSKLSWSKVLSTLNINRLSF